MDRAVNDATMNKAGDIFQYLIALKDCFKLNDGDTLQIEKNGDVSIVNSTRGLFQKEIKHHFGKQLLSDRDRDFWKTLANWYVDYERVKCFSHFILYTTAIISDESSFYDWNNLDKENKLNCLIKIGATKKKNEQHFRKEYNRIFNSSYNQERLLEILSKFTIEHSKTRIDGISKEFAKFIGYIPKENRDGYIGALLGEILIRVKDPPHRWEVTREEFDQILQRQTATYSIEGAVPLPDEFAQAHIPDETLATLNGKKFVEAIYDIQYDTKIPSAMLDYWKADMTVIRYFRDNIMYLKSLESYKQELSDKMGYARDDSELDAEGKPAEFQIKISKKLYNSVMQWNANDFGSIIRNRGFFQRGIIHNIVDETEFRWKVGDE